MTNREPYNYIILRYFHDVATREAVNVGVVMTIPGRGEVLYRMRSSFDRIKRMFPDLNGPAYAKVVDAVRRGMEAVEQDMKSEGPWSSDTKAIDLARKALPVDDSALQWSLAGDGLAEDPRKAFENLYRRFVTRYDRPEGSGRTDEDVWQAVEEKLREHGVKADLKPKRIEGSADSIEFGHAVKNGRWNVYQPLSFDLSDADGVKDKARTWLGHLSAVKKGADDDVLMNFITFGPGDPSLGDAYRSALEILHEAPFENRVFEEARIGDAIHQIERDSS